MNGIVLHVKSLEFPLTAQQKRGLCVSLHLGREDAGDGFGHVTSQTLSSSFVSLDYPESDFLS